MKTKTIYRPKRQKRQFKYPEEYVYIVKRVGNLLFCNYTFDRFRNCVLHVKYGVNNIDDNLLQEGARLRIHFRPDMNTTYFSYIGK